MLGSWDKTLEKSKVCMIIQYTLNVRSQWKQLVVFSQESWCFPWRNWGKHQDSRENKTNWFPKGPDIKHFVSRLSLQQQQKITGVNQNSRRGTYNNTNLILKATQWMIYKVLSSYYLHLFPPVAGCFSSGITFKIVALWLEALCLCCCVHSWK